MARSRLAGTANTTPLTGPNGARRPSGEHLTPNHLTPGRRFHHRLARLLTLAMQREQPDRQVPVGEIWQGLILSEFSSSDERVARVLILRLGVS
jgi:hypothetical protein